MSSINIPLGVGAPKSYTSVSGAPAGTVANLEVKKGAAGRLEVFAHDTDGNPAQLLEDNEGLRAYLTALGVTEAVFSDEVAVERLNSTLLSGVEAPSSAVVLQA